MKKFLAALLSLSLMLTVCAAGFAADSFDLSAYLSELEPDEAIEDGVLAKGEKGPTVAFMQAVLKAAGYYDGKIDGDFGEKTEAAIKALEKDLSLPVTGKIEIEPIIAFIAENIDALYEYLGLEAPEDEELASLLHDLFIVNLTDDDEFDDFALTAWIIDALISRKVSVDDIAETIYVLALYDADPDDDDPDFFMDLALLNHIYGDSKNFERYLRNALSFREGLKSEKYHDRDLVIQDIIIEDLLDDDDPTDVAILLQIVNSFYEGGFDSWDTGRELVLLAIIDAIDDDSLEDVELLNAYAQLALSEEEYDDLIKSIGNVAEFLTNGEYDEADIYLFRLALKDFLDDYSTVDYLSVLELIDAFVEGNKEAIKALLATIPVVDFFDNYDYDDVELYRTFAKLYDKEADPDDRVSDFLTKVLAEIDYPDA